MLLAPLLVVTVAAAPIEVALKAADGVALAATYYESTDARAAVVLMPMLGASRKDWERFAVKAAPAGIAVLLLDPRGHGGSVNPYGQAPAEWAIERWRDTDRDPAAAVAWLEGRGFAPAKIYLGGASIGASLAFRRAASDPRLGGAVLLSPGDNPRRVPVSASVVAYGRRPLLIATAADDLAFDAVADRLAASARGPLERLRLAAGGHGTGMLADPRWGPALMTDLISWFTKASRGTP